MNNATLAQSVITKREAREIEEGVRKACGELSDSLTATAFQCGFAAALQFLSASEDDSLYGMPIGYFTKTALLGMNIAIAVKGLSDDN